MTRGEMLQRLCALTAKVADEVFEYAYSADCFCGNNPFSTRLSAFMFDEEVLQFVETAIESAITARKKKKGKRAG